MTVNIAEVLALFARSEKQALPAEQVSHLTIRGACPYALFGPDAFLPEFADVIDGIRADPIWGPVFNGDLGRYADDHSKADLALCGELARRGLDAGGIDTAIRSSGLYREKWERNDYRARTISKALANINADPQRNARMQLDLINGKIKISTEAPPPRDWVVADLLLAKKSAVLAGFGGVSKTQLAIQLAMDVVLGRAFGDKATKQGGAMMLLGEEDQAEISRRVSAVVREGKLDRAQIALLEANLFGFPFVGIDMRLSRKDALALVESSLADAIIAAAREAGNVNLIVLDHLALMHGGDFNAREDAALTMRIVNSIAQETGAAVLVLAHTPKAAGQKEESDASMVAGSTAFVDQARAALILSTMRENEAKAFGFDRDTRKSYVSLTVAKNNYGPTGDISWFKRAPFDGTALLEPVDLMPSEPPLKGAARLEQAILRIVGDNPGQYAPTRLREKYAGRSGQLRASKGEVERVINGLIEDGRLISRPPTEAERAHHRLSGQTRKVLSLGSTT